MVEYEWSQLNGPSVTLSDENAVHPTFVAGPVNGNATVVFQLRVFDSGDDSDTDTVQVNINENNIDQVPADAISFYTTTNKAMGLKPAAGADMVMLTAIDPDSSGAAEQAGAPQNLIYGLVEFKLAVNMPGSSTTVTVYLPQPLPAGCRLYKYSSTSGWYDYSAHTSFNNARDQITLTLVDGGTGDDDGELNGTIEDPFALGTRPTGISSGNNVSSSGGGGGGSCFIDTARTGTNTHQNTSKQALPFWRKAILATRDHFFSAIKILYEK